MTLYKNINSIKMKTVGAVVFIHILLLIAGVEPNPGPSDTLVFRYQYLLFKVGTELLRKLYDVKVSSYNNFNKDLKGLLATNILTNDQKKLLPPLDKNPNTANYDITLLTCLLRNICGLKHHLDPVWKKPANTDFTVEAEITRLRECRNYVIHKGTVHMSESEFNQEWSKLCQILRRLNNFCSVPNLQKMIDDAKNEQLDDQLKQHYDNILKTWHEAESLFEKGIDTIKIGQSEIKGVVCDLKDGQSQLKDGLSELKDCQSELKYGQSELKDGQSELKDGQSELKDCLSELKDGQSELKDGQSELKDDQSQLKDGQSELKDGLSNLKDGQSELKDSQSQLKDGQSELKDGQSQLKNGQSQLKDGQSELKDGLSQLKDAQSELKDGQSDLKDGQFKLKDGLSQLKDGFENIDKNQKNQTELLQKVQDVQEQSKRKLDNIEEACSSNKRTKFFTDNDIKERLRKSYEKKFRTVCVTPLYNEDDCMDMLTVYARSKMKHVPYHRTRQSEGNYEISSYEQVFSKENTVFRNIFITGDAGMGKTCFGQFMSLLWSKAIAGDIVGNIETQEDARFMTNFDLVFYISLKETNHEDVVSMIVDKYFYTSSKDKYEETIKTIEQILQTKNCLVILDGLDEWRPDISGHRNPSLPRKVTSDCDRCTYLTTCRPYILETIRLPEMDIDHQVQITGFDYEKYIWEVIGYINNSESTNEDPYDFLRQINDSEMDDQLHIPLITSQLIVIWLEYEMSQMNRAMIYGSIVDMLFKRAIKNEIKIPSIASPDVQLPESLSIFAYLLKYVSTLEEVCRLSFLLLFDQNNETPRLVFTRDQLMSEPYNISMEEIDFFCQLGIISKNKEIGSFGEEKHMLSFLHMSYLEFLAALFVSLFDKTKLFRGSVKKFFNNNLGKYHNFLSRYENFLILLSEISSRMIRKCFKIIYKVQKRELDLHRSKIHYFRKSNLDSMQDMAICCLKELCVSENSKKRIKLDDFNFRKFYIPDCLQDLKALLDFNKHNVKSLVTKDYLDEFNEIKSLQYLMIKQKFNVVFNDVKLQNQSIEQNFDVRFNDAMLQNQSTLHTLNVFGFTLLYELPVRSLPFLTSMSLTYMTIEHTILHDLMEYISNNILLENIVLSKVTCETCSLDNTCTPTLNLLDHVKTLQVDFSDIYIECSRINNSCLTSLSLDRSSDCFDNSEVDHVITAIRSLKYIEHLTLHTFTIPDSVPLQIHPDIVCDKYIYIELSHVTMSDKCFQDFIDYVVEHKSVVRVNISNYNISRSNLDSWDYRCQRLQANPSVKKIIHDDNDDDDSYNDFEDDYDNDDNLEVSNYYEDVDEVVIVRYNDNNTDNDDEIVVVDCNANNANEDTKNDFREHFMFIFEFETIK